MYAIQWTPKAARQLRKLDRPAQRTIFEAVQAPEDFPNGSGVKALTAHQYGYRLRVGNYRVLFNADGVVEIVTIEEVKKRDERTY